MRQKPEEPVRSQKDFAEVVALYKRAAASGLKEEARLGGRRVCTMVPPSRRDKTAEKPPQD